jgi:predicted  nucleic acid-binding Zn-ribbon protein
MSPTKKLNLITAEWDREELQELARKLEEAKERFETINLAIEDLKHEHPELDDNATGTRVELNDNLRNYRGEGDRLWEQISEYERALNPRQA